MESPWEMWDIINNGYNFPSGDSGAWCLTDDLPLKWNRNSHGNKHEERSRSTRGTSEPFSDVFVSADAKWQLQSILASLNFWKNCLSLLHADLITIPDGWAQWETASRPAGCASPRQRPKLDVPLKAFFSTEQLLGEEKKKKGHGKQKKQKKKQEGTLERWAFFL